MSRILIVPALVMSLGIMVCNASDNWEFFSRADVKFIEKAPEQESEKFIVILSDGRRAELACNRQDIKKPKYAGSIKHRPGLFINTVEQTMIRPVPSPGLVFSWVQDAFKAQGELAKEVLQESLLHPSIINPATIKRCCKDKYWWVTKGDGSDNRQPIKHITYESERGFEEDFRMGPLSITKDDFEKEKQKSGAIHCSKEVYEARSRGDFFLSIYRKTRIGQDSYSSYLDDWKRKWPKNYQATFQVFKSVYAQQASLRAAQAAKAEETKECSEPIK